MSPGAQSDGHDAPGLVDQAAPSMAAMVEDVGVGFEDTIRVQAGLANVKLRSWAKVEMQFTFAAAAYSLVRIPRQLNAQVS